MTYAQLSRCKVEYSNKEVFKCLILIKKSNNARISDQAKVILLKQMHQIIIKNIENFFNMIKNIDREPIHSKDDMVSEAYIILYKCIRDFEMKRGKYFYWYYNKSLTRGFIRIIEKSYYKHSLVDTVKEEHEDFIFTDNSQQESDMIEFYLSQYKLDSFELRVAKSLVNGEKLKDFLKNNKDISWSRYYSISTSLKKKMEPFRDELKTYTDVKI